MNRERAERVLKHLASTESTPQITHTQLCIEIAGLLRKGLRFPATFTLFPAGGGGKERGRVLKACGLQSGWPDFQIVFRGLLHCGEVKVGDDVLSGVQNHMRAVLIMCGCPVAEWRSINDVKASLNEWKIPLSTVSESSERVMRAVSKFNQSGE
jgi:hypothetical protein